MKVSPFLYSLRAHRVDVVAVVVVAHAGGEPNKVDGKDLVDVTPPPSPLGLGAEKGRIGACACGVEGMRACVLLLLC